MDLESTSSNPTTVDVTGLPEPVIDDLRRLVKTLRKKLPTQESVASGQERLPLRGRFADLKLSIPKEDIDEAQREAWKGFPREFPEPGNS